MHDSLSIQQCSLNKLHCGCYTCAKVWLSTSDHNKSKHQIFSLSYGLWCIKHYKLHYLHPLLVVGLPVFRSTYQCTIIDLKVWGDTSTQRISPRTINVEALYVAFLGSVVGVFDSLVIMIWINLASFECDYIVSLSLALSFSVLLYFEGLCLYTSVAVFLLHIFIFLIFRDRSLFSKEHISIGFTNFPSAGELSSIIISQRGVV